MTRLFVYGTLKKGQRNHNLYEFSKNSEYCGEAIISGAKMYLVGGTIPIVVLSGTTDDKVTGEVYLVKNEVFERVRDMELRAGYEEKTIVAGGEPAKIFTYRVDSSSEAERFLVLLTPYGERRETMNHRVASGKYETNGWDYYAY